LRYIDLFLYAISAMNENLNIIGFLTNRAGRNKIPYHEGNYSFPSGEAARERIIPQVVRNFIPTQAIGQESYSYEF